MGNADDENPDEDEAEQPDIFALCDWAESDDDAMARHGVGDLLEAAGWDGAGEDLFGGPPEVRVHTGDVVIDGPFAMYAQGNGVFILDGSLTVNGPLVFTAADMYTVLVVTGDLRVRDLVQAWDTQLAVKGKTTIDGALFIDVSDAGFSIFEGPVVSRDRVIGARSAPRFASEPEGTLREALPLSAAFRESFPDQAERRHPDLEAIQAAVARGIAPFD